MSLYKFLGKGPAYGLGYTEGELVEIDEEKGIDASVLVNEIYADGPQKGNITGKMVMAKKKYTVDYLVEAGVIKPASAEDKKAFKEGKDINTLADKQTAEFEAKEKAKANALADKIKK
jgi:hypothetical protein